MSGCALQRPSGPGPRLWVLPLWEVTPHVATVGEVLLVGHSVALLFRQPLFPGGWLFCSFQCLFSQQAWGCGGRAGKGALGPSPPTCTGSPCSGLRSDSTPALMRATAAAGSSCVPWNAASGVLYRPRSPADSRLPRVEAVA